jgi:hypothetical protein
VAFRNTDDGLNPEAALSFLDSALEHIKCEADPEVLNEYRAVFRKKVPLFMRTYVAAYLLTEFLKSGKTLSKAGTSRGSARRDERQERAARQERPAKQPKEERAKPAKAERQRQGAADQAPKQPQERKPREDFPRVQLSAEVASQLFFGIGRNRRVYHRDIAQLVADVEGVAKEDLGEIKVLDNYSFVQVKKEVADAVIAALDGKEFHGKKVVVSFARPKGESARDQGGAQGQDERSTGTAAYDDAGSSDEAEARDDEFSREESEDGATDAYGDIGEADDEDSASFEGEGAESDQDELIDEGDDGAFDDGTVDGEGDAEDSEDEGRRKE